MLPDREKSRAVIVGAARYHHVPDLPAVTNNLTAVHRLLTDPEHWGLPPEHCSVLPEPRHPQEVYAALARAAGEATDALVFYYAGHGIVPPENGELYLALADADFTRYYNGVRYDDVRGIIMNTAAAMSKVVLLDCCYSGVALVGGMNAGADIGARIGIDGTYLMTATAENVLAWSPEGEDLTAFTGELIRSIDTGIPEHVEYLTLDKLFYQVRGALAARRLPLPQQRNRNGGAAIVLARNRFHDLGRPAPGEVVPEAHHGALDLAPVLLTAKVAELRRTGQDDAATAILRGTGALRTEQGVASVVKHLEPGDAGLVVAAAAARRPESLHALIETFRETGQPAQVERLLTAVAGGPAGTLTALATRLHEAGAGPDLSALCDAAVDARAGQPQAMIAVVGGLLSAGLHDTVAAVLRRVAEREAAHDTLTLADALREAGREPAALQLYAGVGDLLAHRSVPDTVALAAAMSAAGRDGEADALIGRVAAVHRDGPGLQALLHAVWGMDVAVDDVGLVEHLADGPLAGLVVALHSGGHATQIRRLLPAVLARRAPVSTARVASELRRAGLPVEANRLIDAAVIRPAPHGAQLARELATAGDEDGLRRLVERAVGGAPESTATLLRHLDPGQRRHVWPVLATVGVEHALATAHLVATERPDLVDAILRSLPPETAPARLAAALSGGGPAAPEVVLTLPLLPQRCAQQTLDLVAGSLTVPARAVDAAYSGRFGDPAAAVVLLLRVAIAASAPDLCRALASRPRADVCAVLDALAGTDRGGDPAAVEGLLHAVAVDDLAAAVHLLRRQIGTGRRAHADILLGELRARLTDSRLFPVVSALARHGLLAEAAALLGTRAHGDPADLPDPVVLALTDLFRRSGLAPRRAPGHRLRVRAGIDPGERALCLIGGAVPGVGSLVAFTTTRLIYSRTRPQVYRPWIPYVDLGGVAFAQADRQTIAVEDDDGSVALWPVGPAGPTAARLVALLRAVQETVRSVLDLHRELSDDGSR
jgi:hypothetical protein